MHYSVVYPGNANAQVTHDRVVTSTTVTDWTLDCIDVSLDGTINSEWFWSFAPDGGFNVIIKDEGIFVDEDGNNYTYHTIWNERLNWNANKNKENVIYRWTSSSQLFCEGKLVGVVHWRRQLTIPATGDWVPSVDIDYMWVDCK